MKKLVLLSLLLWLTSACSSGTATIDPSTVQTAIAQTAAANPTETLPASATETPTSTPTPTETSTPTPTSTPTETPSPTPDLRVIDGDPKQFLMEADDLPEDAKYYLPNSSWISPHRNSEIISGWGVDEGREYLAQTGRVDGWWVSFLRGTSKVIAPEEIYNNIVLYRTTEGAQLVITQFSNCTDPDTEYKEVETDLLIGDMTRVCIRREMQSSGKARVWYRIEFTYRNYFHGINGYGWENEVRAEYMEDVARTLLAKLEAASLSDLVTFEP